ncbi:MAG: hypothetical protein K0S08_764 [Gammaproteobacteria bacterium]|jgi:hypothetical protein|nr:hypothetical protein [Gammaproteobacteria bacterium]
MQALFKTIALCSGIIFLQNSFANIGVTSFPMSSFEQTNPVLAGMIRAQEMNQYMLPSKIMIFGGNNHNVYLGCFNCSNIAPDSIFNQVSPYGSSISQQSIYNTIGPYGSEVSDLSACSELAQHPPIIVDNRGNFYGSLTLNNILPTAIKSPQIIEWLERNVCT